MKLIAKSILALTLTYLLSCATKHTSRQSIRDKVEEYIPVELKTDISHLSDNQKQMLPLLFEVSDIMDDLFWQQTWGNKDSLLNSIEDSCVRQFVEINYGPYDRLNNNTSIIEGVPPKSLGGCFYPQDMTLEEFNLLSDMNKEGLYSVVERDSLDMSLKVVPYREKYHDKLSKASELMQKASELAENKSLQTYLKERAKAFLSDDYFSSDMSWMYLNDNDIDFVVGPIETYEDALFGAKSTFEAYVLIKDKYWSAKISAFTSSIPHLQKQLPVPDKYKTDLPGLDSELGIYDVIYCGGESNAGGKTIAINLPNDPRVHLVKGSRKIQLRNVMEAKFEKILLPISELLVDDEQLNKVSFKAFFENAMLHEVAHGLGMKNTLYGESVRSALKENATTVEEVKADVLSLYLITQLSKNGDLGTQHQLMANYVTFMASVFRSVRFGASNSHGKANMLRFNYFMSRGAFIRNAVTGKYKIDMAQMQCVIEDLTHEFLLIQGDGDYERAKRILREECYISDTLKDDLEKILVAGIPKDIRFVQGADVLGL